MKTKNKREKKIYNKIYKRKEKEKKRLPSFNKWIIVQLKNTNAIDIDIVGTSPTIADWSPAIPEQITAVELNILNNTHWIEMENGYYGRISEWIDG